MFNSVQCQGRRLSVGGREMGGSEGRVRRAMCTRTTCSHRFRDRFHVLPHTEKCIPKGKATEDKGEVFAEEGGRVEGG
jgi:hypothetical protein